MYFMRHAMDLLVLLSGGLLTTSIGFAALWVRARERAARAESLLEGMRMGARADSMSPALDAIAEEVERIGESCRSRPAAPSWLGRARREPSRRTEAQFGQSGSIQGVRLVDPSRSLTP